MNFAAGQEKYLFIIKNRQAIFDLFQSPGRG